MANVFYIGAIFENTYPSNAIDWCYKNKASIKEISPEERLVEETYIDPKAEHGKTKTRSVKKLVRRFQIVARQGESVEQKKERVLAAREQCFELYVDWYQSKPLLWSELTKAEKDDIKAYRTYLKDYTEEENWWEKEPLDFDTWKKSK